MVNVAYDAPVDLAPRDQIEDAERRLYELAETGRYDGGFQRFATALTTAVDMAAKAYQRDGKLSGLATGLMRPRPHDGRAAAVRPGHPRRPSGHGQDRACHQHRLQHRARLARRSAPRRTHRKRQWRHRRLLLARNVGASSSPPASSRNRRRFPPTASCAARSTRPTSTASRRSRARWSRCRSTSTRPAVSRSRSSPPARAGSSASAGSICW